MQTVGADGRVREDKAQRLTQCEPPAAEPELPSWAVGQCGCPSCNMGISAFDARGDGLCDFCFPTTGCTGDCGCCQASGIFAAPAAGAASAEPSRGAMAALPAEILEVRKPGWKVFKQDFVRRGL